jgi:hypothetical protein
VVLRILGRDESTTHVANAKQTWVIRAGAWLIEGNESATLIEWRGVLENSLASLKSEIRHFEVCSWDSQACHHDIKK